MTENAVNALPEILKSYICTLRRASFDDANREYMCESTMQVVHFDKIPNEYAKGRGWIGVPKSNDALYIDSEFKWYFIEFKNGTIHKDDVYRKIYDSLIMLIDWGIISDFDFIRKNINYILVYNEGKYGKIQESPARNQNYGYFMKLAKQEEKLFDIDKFEKYLFHEVHTYTQGLFEEKFVYPMEEEERVENISMTEKLEEKSSEN